MTSGRHEPQLVLVADLAKTTKGSHVVRDRTEKVERGAVLSSDGRYRYSLYRRWDRTLPMACFVMLNPSIADADVDDPTIRKCMGFATRWGAGGIRVVNLYPWRATKPRDLPAGPETGGEREPLAIEPRNDGAIRSAAFNAGWIVAAWGR